jgi:hypothetical protein
LDDKKLLTKEQIIGLSCASDRRVREKNFCRKHRFSQASFRLWRSMRDRTHVADVRRLSELDGDNGSLINFPAEAMLNIEALKTIARRDRQARGRGTRRCSPCQQRPGCPLALRVG